MEQLKPCPFCGGESIYTAHRADGTHSIMCRDDTCDVSVSTWSSDTKAEAIAAWNRRSLPEARHPWPLPSKDKKEFLMQRYLISYQHESWDETPEKRFPASVDVAMEITDKHPVQWLLDSKLREHTPPEALTRKTRILAILSVIDVTKEYNVDILKDYL